MEKRFSMVVADVDGTILNKKKQVTEAVRNAITALSDAGILLVLCSGRATRGMEPVIEDLKIANAPIAALNGGVLMNADFSIARAIGLGSQVAAETIAIAGKYRVHLWAYTELDWYVKDRTHPRVLHEAKVVRFEPEDATDFEPILDKVVKVVAVCDDAEEMQACETELKQTLGKRASIARTQPYYLDITHPNANKGRLVGELSKELNLPKEQVVSIGDMPADADMFHYSGLGIAMGNAPDEVKAAADVVTLSCEEDGFAYAMNTWVLPSASNT